MLEWAIIAILWILGGNATHNACLLSQGCGVITGRRFEPGVFTAGFQVVIYLLWPFITIWAGMAGRRYEQER